MQTPKYNSETDCSQLRRYFDDELSPSKRTAFESHLFDCETCRIETDIHNEIKSIPDDIPLPKDFSRIVAATAESQVTGLRTRGERKVTLGIMSGLALLISIVLGAGFGQATVFLLFALEQVAALFSVIGGFILNLVFGIVVILKVAAKNLEISPAAMIGIIGIAIGAVLAYLYLSGRMTGLRDAKR